VTFNIIKVKSSVLQKTLLKTKTHKTDWESMFAKHSFGSELPFRICTDLLQAKKKTNNPSHMSKRNE
jgi:hypothetical protein